MAAAAAKAGNAMGKMAKSANVAFEVLKSMPAQLEKIKGAAESLSRYWRNFQQTAMETGRALGMSREAAMNFDRALMQEAKDLSRAYGINAKDIAKYQQNYSLATGRNVALTKQQTEQMAALSKVAGDATASKLVEEFSNLGVSVSDTLAYTGQIQERAKFLGLSGTKASATMAENLKLAASYSFRNGVEDIERMVLKSQSLKMNMQSVMSAVDKFSTIQGSIERSANLQMLGGSFAQQFSNPMGALYESMADPAAFQDRIIKAIGGKGTYNAKTGQVDFDPITIAQMKAAAEQLGIDANELGTSAMAIKQNSAIDKEIAGKGWSKEQMTAIENLSRTNFDEKTGKHYISYIDKEGKSQSKYIEDLKPEELKIAQDSQMTQEKMWDDVHAIKTKIVGSTEGRARGTVSLNENIEGLKEEGRAAASQLQNIYMPTAAGAVNGRDFTIWDKFKSLFGFTGTNSKIDGASEGFSDTSKGSLYNQKFAEGGIVHADEGAIIPGDSYTGDNVPVQANSGEMILNQQQQGGLFDFLSSIGKGLLNGYLSYKVASKGFGAIKKLASPKLGGIGVSALKIPDVGAVAADTNAAGLGTATKDVSSFRKGLQETIKKTFPETSKALKDVGTQFNGIKTSVTNFGKSIGHATNSVIKFTKLDKVGKAVGRAGKAVSNVASQGIKWTQDQYNAGVSKIKESPFAKKVGKATSRAKTWTKGKYNKVATKIGNSKIGRFSKSVGNVGKAVRTDAGAIGNRLKALNRLNRMKGLSTLSEATKSAGTLGKVASVGSKGLGTVLKSAGTLGKIASIGGKGLSKAVPVVGTALTIAGSVSGVVSASKDYDAKRQEIMSSNMTYDQKKEALGEAKDEKRGAQGKAIGAGVGALAGAAKGAALGSLILPGVGTVIGGAVGALAGAKLGSAVGGLAKPLSKFTRNIGKALFDKKDENASANATTSEGSSEGSSQQVAGGLSQSANDAIVKIYDLLSKRLGGSTDKPTTMKKSLGTAMALAVPGLGIAGALSAAILSKGKSKNNQVFDNKKKGAAASSGKLSGNLYQQANEAVIKIYELLLRRGNGSSIKNEYMKSKARTAMELTFPVPTLLAKGIGNNFKMMFDAVTSVGRNKNKKSEPVYDPITMAQMKRDGVIPQGKQTVASNANKVSTQFAVPTLGIGSKPLPNVKSLPTVGTKQIIKQSETNRQVAPSTVGPKNINLNVSGTIKLDLGGKHANIDAEKLLNNPAFKTQLAEMISKEFNTMGNGGKYNKEGSIRNTQNLYNRNY